MKNIQITEWYAQFVRQQVREGDICIDATMGNGNDTLLLSRLCGETGKVIAFDIQETALTNTQNLLIKENAPHNYQLFLDSHANISQYAAPECVSCIVFNLGYLPGGDHAKATQSQTSISAMEQSLKLLIKGGLLALCIYSGGDSGFSERDAVLNWLKNLNPKKYLVIKCDYYNRPNNPPLPVLVIKL